MKSISITTIFIFTLALIYSCNSSVKTKEENAKQDSTIEQGSLEKTKINDCDKFLGVWKYSRTHASDGFYNLSVSKDGENYIVKTSGTCTGSAGEYVATCDNGKLSVVLPFTGKSELTWSNNKEVLYFDGHKFKRVGN